jgi:beta-galactosidase
MAFDWSGFLYGGDYNPEQWPREVWDEDVRLMGLAGWNVVSIPIFGWAALEPSEGVYDFEWLDDAIGRLHSGGVQICLATATASIPNWLSHKYPEVRIVNQDGVRQKAGNRHNFCPHAPAYQQRGHELVRRIKERYGRHPGLVMWHINNEYGTYCYCDLCAEAFRQWLKDRYETLERLNDAWYTRFWGRIFTSWDQIETPTSNGEGALQAYRLDYHRFMSDSLLNLFRMERDILRDPERFIPITTNLMGAFFPLDYHRWAKEMDMVSWDNYPGRNPEPANVAFYHALMRGLKGGQPFLLMEQSPSQQNWQRYNTLKKPGDLRLQSLQTVAHGADSIMYFQWRRGRGGIEKLHGAVVEHGGNEHNRVFNEVAAIGRDLEKLGTRVQNARVDAKVALLFDWENWWALSLSSGPNSDLDYPRLVLDYYRALHHMGIDVEVLSPSADLSQAEVIVAPTLSLLREEDAARIAERVQAGATLVATCFTGMTDANDKVYMEGAPGPWRGVLGIRVEETDAKEPDQPNVIVFPAGGNEFAATLLCDRIHLEGAEALAYYAHDFFADEPAVTRNRFGEGLAYYVATHPDAHGIRHIMAMVCGEKGLAAPIGFLPEGLEVTTRVAPNGERQLYILNHSTTGHECVLPWPSALDLLSGEEFIGSFSIPAKEVRVLVSTSA